MNKEDYPEREEMRERSQRIEQEKKQQKEENASLKNKMKEKLQKGIEKRTKKTFWTRYRDYIAYSAIALIVLILVKLNLAGGMTNLSDTLVNEDTRIQEHNASKKGYSLKLQGFFQGMTQAQATELFKNSLTNKKTKPRCNTTNLQDVVLPESHNFYQQNPNCRFNEVQPKCAASYALAPASAYRNRFCKFNMGEDFTPSLDYLFNCDTKNNRGCKKGFLLRSLDFVNDAGYVSEKCFKDLNSEEGKCPSESELSSCQHYKLNGYCVLEGVDDIKREMFKNGPVVTIIQPFHSFLLYNKGLYNIDENETKLDGLQAVKIIGWDTDNNGKEWWIIENFWGQNWGEDGTARVLIGSEDSLLDKFAVAIYPAFLETTSAEV